MADTAVTPTVRSRPTPAALLLVAGTVLLLSAAAVFTVREWERIGLTGQAVVLAGATVTMAAGAAAAWRRRLRGTAEALASVTAGLAVLDAAGARVHGLAGAGEMSTAAFLTIAGLVIGTVATAAAVLAGRAGHRLATAGAVACMAVPLTAASAVGWIAGSIRTVAISDDAGGAGWAAVGVVEGFLVVGLLLLGAGVRLRRLPGAVTIAGVTRITGTVLLAVLGIVGLAATTAVLTGGVDGAGDVATVAPRLAVTGLAGLLLAVGLSRRRRAVAFVAAVAGWVALVGVSAAGAGWLAAAPEARVLAPVALLAVTGLVAGWAVRLGVVPLGPVREAAGWVLIAAAAISAVVVTALSVERAVALARVAATGGPLVPDPAVARALATCAVVVALVAAVPGPAAGRTILRRAAPAAVLTVAASTLVWALAGPSPFTATVLAGAAASAATVAVVLVRSRRRRLPPGAVPAAVAGVAAWWSASGAAASGDPVTSGVWLTLLGATAVASAATTRSGDVARLDGVAAAGVAVAALGLWLAGGDGRLGTVLALTASAVVSWLLTLRPSWPLARTTAFVAGGAAAAALVVSLPAHDPAVAAAVGAGVLAHALAGSVAGRGRDPFLPAIVRHVAVPGSAAWLSVELLAMTGPVTVPGIDAGALPAVAVLGPVALYLAWLLAPPCVSAGTPVTGRRRVLVRDLLLPSALALLAACAVAAILPALAPLPVDGAMIPLLAVLVAIAVNASMVTGRDDPAHPVPLVWVRDVVLRVTESLIALVAVHALQPLTGLPVEYEVAVVAAITLGAHATRTAVARARDRLSPGVTVYDIVTLGSAVILGVLGVAAGESPLWVSGATWLLNGAWGLVVAVLVRGALAGPFPGRSVARGWLALRTGAATATVGYLLMLTAGDRLVVDAVTVPVGLLLVAFGAWSLVDTRGAEPEPSSLRAVGPGLVVVLVPSALIAVTDPGGWRPVLVAAAATAVALVGAVVRWKAPLVVGVVVAVGVASVQATPLAAAVDGWVWLAVGGALTIGLGATFEEQVRRARVVGAQWGSMR